MDPDSASAERPFNHYSSDLDALTSNIRNVVVNDASAPNDSQAHRAAKNGRRRMRYKHRKQANKDARIQPSSETEPSNSEVWMNPQRHANPSAGQTRDNRNVSTQNMSSPSAGPATSNPMPSTSRPQPFRAVDPHDAYGPSMHGDYYPPSYPQRHPQFGSWEYPSNFQGWSAPGNPYTYGNADMWYVPPALPGSNDGPDSQHRRLYGQWSSQYPAGRTYQLGPSRWQQQQHQFHPQFQSQYPQRQHHQQDELHRQGEDQDEYQHAPAVAVLQRSERSRDNPHAPPRPIPTTAYLQAARAAPTPAHDTLPTPRPLLVVVDLNGTLLTRKRRSGTFTLRASARTFLDYVLSAHKLLIWTSATPQSVAAIRAAGGLFRDADEEARVLGFWARDRLRLAPAAYRSKVQVYKRLEWVWEDEGVQAAHPGYADGARWGPADTVLVDDTLEKAAAQPHNLVLVPEMQVAEEQWAEADRPLVKVLRLLEQLSLAADVSKELCRLGTPHI